MASVQLDRVRKVYDNGQVAVHGASFEIADGELMITDAEATAKSAPAFWREFEHLGGLAR